MQHTLESQRSFPYIAWITVVGFAFFTFTLSLELKAAASDLSEYSDRNVEALKAEY